MTGATFPERLKRSAEVGAGSLVVAFAAARRIFRLDEAWDAVSALDLRISSPAQIALYREISAVLRRQTFWLSRRAPLAGVTVDTLIDTYRPVADALLSEEGEVLSRFEQGRLDERVRGFIAQGIPEDMARKVGLLRPQVAVADIGDLAREADWPVPCMARLYHQVGAAFDLDRLRFAAGQVPSVDHFDRLAVRRLIQDFMVEQMVLTRAVARASDPEVGRSEAAAEAAVDAWIGHRLEVVEAMRASVDEIEQSGQGWTFAKLTIANATVREVAASAG